MEEAEAASAKSWGTALGSVGFDVLATRDVNGIIRTYECATPSPLVFWNDADTRERRSKSLR
jgi:hypothetical protein